MIVARYDVVERHRDRFVINDAIAIEGVPRWEFSRKVLIIQMTQEPCPAVALRRLRDRFARERRAKWIYRAPRIGPAEVVVERNAQVAAGQDLDEGFRFETRGLPDAHDVAGLEEHLLRW